MTEFSVQDRYAPNNHCFGCGPANAKGLRIKSFQRGEELVAEWTPEVPTHEAFDGMLNGGIIGSLLDCHCNWTAAMHLMKKTGANEPPCTVTAEYKIELKCPTPSAGPVFLRAQVIDSSQRRANVEGSLEANGKICATCSGVFIAVKEGHPAFHRW